MQFECTSLSLQPLCVARYFAALHACAAYLAWLTTCLVCVQNIHVTAYSPLGTPPSSAMFKDYQPDLVMNDPVVKDIAKKYNKNVGQV